ncbi:hypothetical protein [Streptomyces sp. NPDC058751]|uniref:hypothetical protein n=1 Tax=Streptomyces sp. NPDC058751 TaxID=3346623 RepID=UPI0036A22A72
MKDTYELYRHAVDDVWKGWWVSWPLSQRVALGDVLHDADGRVRTAGTLVDRGIAFDSRPGTPENTYKHDAQGSVSVSLKAAGSAADGFASLAVADAGARIGFTKGNTAFVVYDGLTETTVADTRALASALVSRGWEDWDDSLLAVTGVVAAASGTVLTTTESGAFAELRVRAGAGPVQPVLADLAGNASIEGRQALGLEWLGTDLTPFFRVVRLRKAWFGKVRKDYGPRQPGRGAAPVPVPPVLLEEAQDDPGAVLEDVSPAEQPPLGFTTA